MTKIEKLREINKTVSKMINSMETRIFIESGSVNNSNLNENLNKEIKTKKPVNKKR